MIYVHARRASFARFFRRLGAPRQPLPCFARRLGVAPVAVCGACAEPRTVLPECASLIGARVAAMPVDLSATRSFAVFAFRACESLFCVSSRGRIDDPAWCTDTLARFAVSQLLRVHFEPDSVRGMLS